MYETLLVEDVKEHVKKITLNRPSKLNAMSLQMVDDILDVCAKLRNDQDCRVVILTGAERGFCAGVDLGEISELSKDPDFMKTIWFLQKKTADIPQEFRRIPQPIIAAVNGAAAGAGAAMALASDIRIAGPSAKFILSFINVGLSATDMGTGYFLPRLVGMSRASEIMLTGRPVLAEEAVQIGLVSKLVDNDSLMQTALEYSDIMLGKSDFGLRMTKEMINEGTDAGSLAHHILAENRNQVICSGSGSFGKSADNFKNAHK